MEKKEFQAESKRLHKRRLAENIYRYTLSYMGGMPV